VEGHKNNRGDPGGGRAVRCVAEGVEMTTPSAISISQPSNSFFVTIGIFESRRNILFRRPHALSLPTTTQAGETCHFAAHIHPYLQQLLQYPHLTPYHPNCDCAISRTHRRQPRLPLMSLWEFVSSSACVCWGDTSWWVVSTCVNGGVNSPPFLETPAVA